MHSERSLVSLLLSHLALRLNVSSEWQCFTGHVQLWFLSFVGSQSPLGIAESDGASPPPYAYGTGALGLGTLWRGVGGSVLPNSPASHTLRVRAAEVDDIRSRG